MAGEWLLATQFAAAALMVGLAIWLCWLDFRSRAVRAFAVFLVLRAAVTFVGRWGALVSATEEARLAAVLGYYNLALPFALLYFLLVYPSPRRPLGDRSALPLVALALVGVEIAYFLDHCLFGCEDATGRLIVGPLYFVSLSLEPILVIAAYVLGRDASRTENAHTRHSLALVATAFIIDAAASSSTFVGAAAGAPVALLASYGPSLFAPIAVAIPLLSLAAGGWGAWAVGRATARTTLGVWFVVAISSFAVGAGMLGWNEPLAFGILGLWRLLVPLLVGYALLRHRLFGIDLRVRGFLNHASIGAFFAAVFFVVSEGVATFLGPRVGTFAGIAAAGVLLFALTPLHHAAARIVDSAVGRTPPGEPLAFYRQMAERAWANGYLSREERKFLDDLRSRLGVDPVDAARVESEAAGSSPPTQETTT